MAVSPGTSSRPRTGPAGQRTFAYNVLQFTPCGVYLWLESYLISYHRAINIHLKPGVNCRTFYANVRCPPGPGPGPANSDGRAPLWCPASHYAWRQESLLHRQRRLPPFNVCQDGLAGSSAGTATKLLPLRAALPSGGRGSPATRTPSRMIPTHSDRQTGSDPVPPRGRCSLDSNRWRSRFDPRRWLLSPGQPEEMDPSLKSQRSDGPGSTRDPRGLGGRPATPTQLASVRVAP